MHILRVHLSGDERPDGWLGALAGPHIGSVLRLMRSDIARRWKVGDLANEVDMSSTTFAERFKSLVGMAPLEYLTRWHMTLAGTRLCERVDCDVDHGSICRPLWRQLLLVINGAL